jgi:hypothetical protein
MRKVRMVNYDVNYYNQFLLYDSKRVKLVSFDHSQKKDSRVKLIHSQAFIDTEIEKIEMIPQSRLAVVKYFKEPKSLDIIDFISQGKEKPIVVSIDNQSPEGIIDFRIHLKSQNLVFL